MNELSFDVRISTFGRTLVDVRGFSLLRNGLTILFGESGVGKSLIAKAVYGLLDPDIFTVSVNGEAYKRYRSRPETIGRRRNGFFVFQEPSTHLDPLMTLGDQLREGDLAAGNDDRTVLGQLWRSGDPRIAGAVDSSYLDLLKIFPKPYRPSGGEKQRIFLAMALKKIDIERAKGRGETPGVFIFDEPTGSLDNHFRNVFLAMLLERFRSNNFTALLITHDYSIVSEIAARHSDLLRWFAFKEIALSGRSLALKEFKTERYLGWIRRQKPRSEISPPGVTVEPRLVVESGARVFGRRLLLSRESGEAPECALELRPGTMAYLRAPSGTGKTTLLKLIMGLFKADGLWLWIDGITIDERTPRRFWQEQIWGRKMTLVFQHADEALNPQSTVAEIFNGLPTDSRRTKDVVRAAVQGLFDVSDIDVFMNSKVGNLSGGQKQCLNLLRGVVLSPEILLLDEPLNGLDFERITKVLAMLEDQQNRGMAVLVVSHNEDIFNALVKLENTYYLRFKPDEVVVPSSASSSYSLTS